MISLSCAHCHKNLKVKAELAGKKVRCPGCREIVAIPAANDDATVPPQISPAAFSATPMPVSDEQHSDEAAGEDLEAGTHYRVGAEIARGGMGAILRAVDQDIQREVAVKFLLNQADARQRARFLEEAQITGQLEHPNIVPIHQLGVHEDGCCFFSMKMVKGRSLAQILKDEKCDYTLGRLLTIFASICNAMAYAHSRNVIHRDLKPANIMVGDFGEVYVMDWGLAKVLGKDEEASARSTAIQKKKAADTHSGGKSGAKIKSGRLSDSGLTQDGAVMGTPAYMPPEQAKGDIAAVDHRSDIYSLGAILYEILTLTPPVGRGGDALSILMKVMEGKIDPPAARAPKRWIPPELSAIAMKALATSAEERYQTVEELQRDIQLFQEGRSVSAKQDSRWEQFVKLIKRNKGLSVGLGVALLVLLGSLGFLINAWIETGRAYAAYQKEQQDKREQGKKSIPALLRAARSMLAESQFDDAQAQVKAALQFDENEPDARLLLGQMFLGESKFTEAHDEISAYVKARPDDAVAQKLAELSRDVNPEDSARLLALADVLAQQKVFAVSDLVSRKVQDQGKFRAELAVSYQKRLKAAWPGATISLHPWMTFGFRLDLDKGPGDLTPLQGMKLETLHCNIFKDVRDLRPLGGMPLQSLEILNRGDIRDLTPLAGMPLTRLSLSGAAPKLQDLAPLRGLKLAELNLRGSYQVTDITPLAGMPLSTLTLQHSAVENLSPLQGMPLTDLNLSSCGKVTSIDALRGLKLTKLNLSLTPVKDLAPLRDMPLSELILYACGAVSDLKPLAGTKLTVLNLYGCGAKDLTPLEGLKLKEITLSPWIITQGMDVLRRMESLEKFGVDSGAPRLTPAEFWKRYDAGEFKKK